MRVAVTALDDLLAGEGIPVIFILPKKLKSEIDKLAGHSPTKRKRSAWVRNVLANAVLEEIRAKSEGGRQ